MHRLTDSFDRHINYLRISVTDRCNLRCMYCMPPEGIALLDHDKVLRYEEILRIVRIVAGRGIRKIRITGGEPLVRKGIAEFIASLCDIDGISDLSLTTNGTLLEQHARALHTAGMQRINISLDTLDPDRYRTITRTGELDSVLAGITAARIAGFDPIKINVVVMRGVNDDEVLEFAHLTRERPVHIRFIEYMPFDGQARDSEEYFISNDDIQARISDAGTLIPCEPPGHIGPARMFRLEGARGLLGFISPLSNHFCEQCNRLRLTADGKLRTCLFSDTETDLRTPLRAGCSDEDLLEIITRAVLAKPARHGVLEPSFRKCARGMSAIGG